MAGTLDVNVSSLPTIDTRSESGSDFPKDDLPLGVKEGKSFALQVARSIWGFNKHYDTHLFYNDRRRYRKILEYALGRQEETQYKPFLGLKPEENDTTWLRAINFGIKNYATKRVNIAVSKMINKDYEPVVSTNDPISNDLKTNLKNQLSAMMDNQKELRALAQRFNSEQITQRIPKDREELEMIMEFDFRMIEAIHLELAIPWHMAQNKYDKMRKQMNFDLFVFGVGCMYVGMDDNMMPFIERVNPSDIIAPYNENPDFDKVPYVARIKWVTAQEFRKLSTGYLSEGQIEEALMRHSRRPDETGDFAYNRDLRRYDDVNKVPLLHFNYRSPDTLTFLQKPDAFGNMQLFEKPIDYYARPHEIDKFVNKFGESRKIIRQSLNAVYEGYWIVGSETVFRYGRRGWSDSQYGSFAQDIMGYKIFAPNSWDGMIASTGAQMIPMLDELQKYNLKVQQIVARAIPKGIGIDLFALRKANLKWGGKGMTDQQKIEMFMRSGIFVFSSKDRYAPGSNYKPFYEIENGLANDIGKYLQLIQQSLLELDEIIGINKITAASNVREDAGKAVTELQVEASEVALDYLYKADKSIFRDVVEQLGVLHIKSFRYSKKNQELYKTMFGETGAYNNELRFDLFKFGFEIEARPTAAEWQELYLSAEKAYDKGILEYSDTIFLREFKSLKQARYWLMLKEKKAKSDASAAAQANIEQNAMIQNQSLQSKAKADIAVDNNKLKNELALENEKRITITHKGNIDLAVQERIKDLQGDIDIEKIEEKGDQERETEVEKAENRKSA